MNEEDRRRVEKATETALKESGIYDVTYWIQTPDGRKIFIHARGKVRRDSDGNPVYAHGTIQDVTEYKLIGLEKERIRKNLSDAQSLMHVGSWEWTWSMTRCHGRMKSIGCWISHLEAFYHTAVCIRNT